MDGTKESITTGKWSVGDIEDILGRAALITGAGERIEFLSRLFLGTPYREATLTGGEDTAEVLVINLAGVDCFTFLDYVEAMRLSSSFRGFKECLKRIRYQGGVVYFRKRNHFFTDWREFNAGFVEDVTGEVGLDNTRFARKVLNLKEDGSFFVPGVRPVQRDIGYIPSSLLDDYTLGRLKSGDYIGIYSGIKGLDACHVGIFIREGKSLVLRHASSSEGNRKVVDQDFMEYAIRKPGIIVLRPKDQIEIQR